MGSRRPRADAAPFNFQHYIQQSLKQGETLRYALILCNVYKRGIQKVNPQQGIILATLTSLGCYNRLGFNDG